jgi:hypothetical protein
MRRRHLLAGFAAIGGSLLSGCVDRVPIGSEPSAASASTRSPAAPSLSAAESTGPNGSSGDSRECPPIGASVVCYRAAPPDAPVVLVPTARSVSLIGESIGFTLWNRSGSELLFRPYNWQLWRWDGRWRRIDDGGDRPSVGETVLNPGGSYSWQVAVGPITVTADRPPVTLNGLDFEPGRYAFALPVRRERRHTYAAAFAVTE